MEELRRHMAKIALVSSDSQFFDVLPPCAKVTQSLCHSMILDLICQLVWVLWGGLGEVGQFARVRQARLKVDRHTVIDSKSVGDQPYWICDLCDVYCVLVFVFFCYTFQLFVCV